ncbi:DUF6683 family protein [Sphingobacterium thalpophilum]|uniref:DUF6683 family protein n=1 Tax=Sphingobacterium thalpophilum TaxID=259 RepID=UPI003D9663C9
MTTLKKTSGIFLLLYLFVENVFGQIGNPGLMYQGAFNNAMFLTTKSAIESSVKNAPDKDINGKLSKSAVAELTFVASSKVHEKVLDLIANIAAKGDHDRARSAVKTIGKANFMLQFDKLLLPYELNRFNVPDVFTAFIILSWQAISGKDARVYRAGVQRFRKEIHNAMRNNHLVVRFTNDQKQEIAEILSYMAIFFTVASREQSKNGDSAALNLTRQHIRQAVISVSGIDLTKCRFDDNGLTEK